MHSTRFDPEAPPHVGGQVRMNAGEFEGYAGTVTRIDEQRRVVYFAVTVFKRPVELSLDYDTAAVLLDAVTERSAEPFAAADRGRMSP